DLSKVEAGKLELHNADVDLRALIDQVASVMRPLADAKGLDLTVELAADLGLVHPDEGRLRQILLNLASNAVKFTPTGGQVTTAVGTGSAFVIRLPVRQKAAVLAPG